MAPKAKAAAHGKKARITVTLEPDNLAWATGRVAAGEYRSVSHAVDAALAAMRERSTPSRRPSRG
jgi:Arc/MetJ-type ribon-helix-helix transcriptional regulator